MRSTSSWKSYSTGKDGSGAHLGANAQPQEIQLKNQSYIGVESSQMEDKYFCNAKTI